MAIAREQPDHKQLQDRAEHGGTPAQISEPADSAVPTLDAPLTRRRSSAGHRVFTFALYNCAAVAVLFLVCEGAASVYYAFHNAWAAPPVAESLYTRYDRDLGWVNRPNVYLPNMYGPGKFLKTNSQGFRNDHDFSQSVPPGKVRIICSGDSFTLGFGVDNENTWPQLLATHAPNLETVNMGQGGYGSDQAYLWFKRDGQPLVHNVHLFAVIYPDLYRMQHASFNGYGKPQLKIANGRLVVTNVPVPRSVEVWAPRLARAEDALADLAVTRLLRSTFGLDKSAPAVPSEERNEATVQLLTLMLDDLVTANRETNSTLVLAYLPIREELSWKNPGYWRGVLADYARQHGVPFVDLSDDFRRLPPETLDKYFIVKGAIDARGAAGHYTEAGNAFVAGLLYDRMLANRQTAAKLQGN